MSWKAANYVIIVFTILSLLLLCLSDRVQIHSDPDG